MMTHPIPRPLAMMTILVAALTLAVDQASAGCPYSSLMSSFRSLVPSWLQAGKGHDHQAIKDSRALAAKVDFRAVKVGGHLNDLQALLMSPT